MQTLTMSAGQNDGPQAVRTSAEFLVAPQLTYYRYCVRPNSGRIEPKKDVEVQVLLQSMKEDPPPDAKCRDKFLVQSIAISPDNEYSNITQVVRLSWSLSLGSIADNLVVAAH